MTDFTWISIRSPPQLCDLYSTTLKKQSDATYSIWKQGWCLDYCVIFFSEFSNKYCLLTEFLVFWNFLLFQVLHDLLDRNSILRQQVNRLEAEKNTTLELLKSKIKIAWPYPVWIHHRPGMMPEPSAVMTTPIAMDSSVQEVTVASWASSKLPLMEKILPLKLRNARAFRGLIDTIVLFVSKDLAQKASPGAC